MILEIRQKINIFVHMEITDINQLNRTSIYLEKIGSIWRAEIPGYGIPFDPTIHGEASTLSAALGQLAAKIRAVERNKEMTKQSLDPHMEEMMRNWLGWQILNKEFFRDSRSEPRPLPPEERTPDSKKSLDAS